MAPRAVLATVVLALSLPLTAQAQVPVEPPLPCPWWDCQGDALVVVEDYRVEVLIEDNVATTLVRQVLRNDSRRIAEGTFLHPIPLDAAVTGLTLWIDGEPVSGELLDGEAARRTYEEIVRRTLDPALLEFAEDGLLRLSVFPIQPGETRTVEIEYRQVLASDAGLFSYQHPMGREHNVEIEALSARIEIRSPDGIKSVYSPTHQVSVNRTGRKAVVGYEADAATNPFTLYYSTDSAPVSVNVLSYREGESGYFLLLASPGLADEGEVIPKDVVIVLDTSGSMEGEKIDQARQAARFVLANLNPEDRFEVIAFSTTAESYADGLRPATAVESARSWVSGLAAGGSTNIDLALSKAFKALDGDRPGYVVFLTDGLPTEGVTDTATILSNLEKAASDMVSVFAFGVGYDVDTFLLDSIARDHHGTTRYVTPNEEIDAAVEALYSKVASPVLTNVTVSMEGVAAGDMHPLPLPDVFRGGQLVVAGRYDGWGEATVTLRGSVRGEPTVLLYEGVPFRESGGDPAVPRLWATRKIGDLLRSVRLDGPEAETIEQIVRLSIRWGIVTPYTSYLVTEDAPFGEDAIEEITLEAERVAASTTAPVSGADAFEMADLAAGLTESEATPTPDEAYAGVVQIAGDRAFRLTDGVWIDTTYDPDMPLVRLGFGSPDYFSLAAVDTDLASALTVGGSVLVVHDGTAYQIVEPGEQVDPLPTVIESAGTTEAPQPLPAPTLISPAALEADDEPLPVTLVAVGAGLAAALLLALVSMRRS